MSHDVEPFSVLKVMLVNKWSEEAAGDLNIEVEGIDFMKFAQWCEYPQI